MFTASNYFSSKLKFAGDHVIGTADGALTNVESKGTVPVVLLSAIIHLNDVLLVPELQFNLISIGTIGLKGLTILLTGVNCTI